MALMAPAPVMGALQADEPQQQAEHPSAAQLPAETLRDAIWVTLVIIERALLL